MLALWAHLWNVWVSNSDSLGCGMRLPTLYSCGICPGGACICGRREWYSSNMKPGSGLCIHYVGLALPHLISVKILGGSGMGCESVEDGGETDLWWELCGSPCNLHWDVNVSSPNTGLHVNQRRPERSWKHSLTSSQGVSQRASEEEDGIFYIYPLQWAGKVDSHPGGLSVYSAETPLQRQGPTLRISEVQNPTQRKE